MKDWRLIFLGPPGSGKGTCASGVAKELGFLHFSTGDYLRGMKAAKDLKITALEKKYSERGILIPDEEINKIVFEKMGGKEFSLGYILDGFPRTLEQAIDLEREFPTDHVFYFAISPMTISERMKNRRLCSNNDCNLSYNLVTAKPKREGVCDKCESPLYQREDDADERAIRKRFNVYDKQTKPVVELYRKFEIEGRIEGFHEVDAALPPEKVREAIRDVLSKE